MMLKFQRGKGRNAWRTALCLTVALLLGLWAQAQSPGEVLGQANTRYTGVSGPDSRSAETGLGNAVADAVREAADAALCVIPGGLIGSDLMAGDVSLADLERVLPEDAPLAVAELTVAQLRALLEECVDQVVVDEKQAIDYDVSANDGYPQISGFTLRYDVSAPVGERIVRIWDADGVELDLTDDTMRVRVASVEGFFAGEYGPASVSHETLDQTVLDALTAFVREGGLTGEEDGRVTVVGSSDDTLLGDFPIALAALTLIFLLLAFRVFYHPKPSYANGFKMPPKSERYDDLAQPEPDGDEKSTK